MKQFVLSFNPDFPDSESNVEITLSGREFHYLIHVRRYSAGDTLPALTPDGRVCEMRILHTEKNSCKIRVTAATREAPEIIPNQPRITLMPAVTKGRKMDLTIRQAVEAGAFAIWPVLAENCQVKYARNNENTTKNDRWKRIAVEALQQCGGLEATEIKTPRNLTDTLDLWKKRGPLFFLHEQFVEEKESSSLHRYLAETVEDLAIMIGPEGGLSPGETNLLRNYGAKPVYLGKRVLRAETAALYGLAAVSTIIREKTEWQMV